MRFVFSDFGWLSLVALGSDDDFDEATEVLEDLRRESELMPISDQLWGLYLYDGEGGGEGGGCIFDCRLLTCAEVASLGQGVPPWEISE